MSVRTVPPIRPSAIAVRSTEPTLDALSNQTARPTTPAAIVMRTAPTAMSAYMTVWNGVERLKCDICRRAACTVMYASSNPALATAATATAKSNGEARYESPRVLVAKASVPKLDETSMALSSCFHRRPCAYRKAAIRGRGQRARQVLPPLPNRLFPSVQMNDPSGSQPRLYRATDIRTLRGWPSDHFRPILGQTVVIDSGRIFH